MKYVLQFGPETMHIQMQGAFTFEDSRGFRQMLRAIVHGEHRDVIHLDLSALSHLDSTGLRLLMMVHDAAKRTRRVLVFFQPQGDVLDALTRAARYNALTIAA